MKKAAYWGEFITVSHRLVRDRTSDSRGRMDKGTWRAERLPAPMLVLCTGTRVLSNGFNDYTDGYPLYIQTGTVPALSVVASPKTKPFSVLPEHVIEEPNK